MPYIKADNDKEQRHFDFLEDLRKSGEVNMFGASPYLQAAFRMKKEVAIACLSKWMKLHDDPSRRLEKTISKEKVSVKMRTHVSVDRESREDS